MVIKRRVSESWVRRLKRRRSEVVERSFAHVCDTGGARRSWLRGIVEVSRRCLLQAAAHNLGVVLRKLLGMGKPREFAAAWAFLVALLDALLNSLMPRALILSHKLRPPPPRRNTRLEKTTNFNGLLGHQQVHPTKSTP